MWRIVLRNVGLRRSLLRIDSVPGSFNGRHSLVGALMLHCYSARNVHGVVFVIKSASMIVKLTIGVPFKVQLPSARQLLRACVGGGDFGLFSGYLPPSRQWSAVISRTRHSGARRADLCTVNKGAGEMARR